MTYLYLSGPISNTPTHREDFARDQARLERAGFEVLNPLNIGACRDLTCEGEFTDDPDHPVFVHSWQCYMRYDIAKFVFCDGIALQIGWNLSKGATLENSIFRGLQLPSKTVDRWIYDAEEE